jgi:hypothetical protein
MSEDLKANIALAIMDTIMRIINVLVALGIYNYFFNK